MKNSILSRLFAPLISAIVFLSVTAAQAAPLTPGNLVILRLGDGSGSPANSSTTTSAGFLDEYTTSGSLVQSIAIPTGVATAGGAATEGFLSRSPDGSRVYFPGYATAAGQPAGGSAAASVARVAMYLDASGAVNVAGSSNDSLGQFRSVAGATGTSNLYFVSATTGVRVMTTPTGATPTTSVVLENINSRQLLLSGTTLFGSNTVAGTTLGVRTYGTLPSSATASTLILPASTTSASGFTFVSLTGGGAGDNTLYVAHTPGTGTQNTVEKYSLVTGSWVARGAVNLPANTSAWTLTASASGGTTTLYAVQPGFAGGASPVYKLTDSSGYNATMTGSFSVIIAAAPANTDFRGISLAPASVATAPEIAVTETGVGNIPDDTGTFSFGTTTVGTPVTKTFTVTNSGTATLNLAALSFPSGFTSSGFVSSTVAASGGTTTFQVTMSAAAAATPSGTLSITNNDGDENPYNFAISGTVTAPAGIAQMGSSASQYSTSSTMSYTVNAGTDRLLVVALGDPNSFTNPTAVTYNGTPMLQANVANDGQYSNDAIWYLKLDTGASITGNIVATFAAGGNGTSQRFIGASAYSGVDQTTPVDINGPKLTGSHTGTNLGSSLNVTSQTGDVVFDLFDAYYTPSQSSITTGASQTRINDAGGAITPSGGFGHYVTSTEAGAPTVTMSWTSNAEAVLHLTMNINAAAGGAPTAPEIAVSETVAGNIADGGGPISFGTTTVGTPVTKTFTVTNTGSAPLNLSGLLAPSGFAVSQDFASTTVASGGGTTTFQIQMHAVSAGPQSGSVTFTSNDADEGSYDFTISGTVNPPPAPEIAVTGNGNDIPNGDSSPSATDHTDFGAGTVVRSFSIQNLGTADLTLSGSPKVVVGGANTLDFTVIAQPDSPVTPSFSSTFQVRFSPTGFGVRNAIISIANNDSNEAPFTFAVSGDGGSGFVADDGGPGYSDGGLPTSATPGYQGDQRELTTGGDSTRWTFTGLTPNSPYRVSATWQTIPGADTAAIYTIYDSAVVLPNLRTQRSLNQTLAPNDLTHDGASWEDVGWVRVGAGGTLVVTLARTSGIALVDAVRVQSVVGPEVHVTRGSDFVLTGDTVTLPTTVLVGTSSATSFSVANVGTGSLTIGAVSLGGSNPGDFAVTTAPASPVSGGGNTTLQITFTPSAVGSRTATVSFATNDGDENPFSFTIQGTGTFPQTFDLAGNAVSNTPFDSGETYIYTLITSEIAIEQPLGTGLTDGVSSVNFGAMEVAGTSALTFTIRNLDLTGTMNLGAITFDGTNPGDFSVTTPPSATVGPNSSTTMVVTFKPLNDGARAAAMHIANDDGDENPFDIALTGTGKPVIGGTWPPGTPIVTTTGPFDATGLTFDTDLGFVPTPPFGPIVFIHADGGITGNFNDLPDGGVVAMSINGVIYYFQVDYGPNDITLTPFTPSGPPAWRWAAGPNTRNNAASFGTINVAAGTNNPGARQGAMNWRGADGSLWMFGGYGYATAVTNPPKGLNDLWQYNRVLGQWIWRSGASTHSAAGTYGTITVEAAGNTPGARHTGTTWTDDSGNLWLFGGVSGTLRNNDLWRYNTATGQWAWMKGSNATGQTGTYGVLGTPAAANTPGARQGAVGWFTPDGNLWLFGGTSNGSAYFNDLWRYTIATGNWTWMGGSNTTGAFGTYGVQGTPAPANVPGARRDATGWVAADGSLWLFGGLGLPASGAAGDLDDLWRYNRGTGEWTWMKGSNVIATAAVYGVQGTPAAANTPGGRSAGSGWSTVDGKFWLVGGFINSSSMNSDVWIYDSVTNNWVWHLGDNTTNALGTYGTLGVAAPGNKPGARFTPSTWVTLNGALWIFGGGGVDALGGSGRLSDLWSYSIPPPPGAPLLPAPESFPEEFIVNEDPDTSDASAGTMAYVPVSGQLTGSDADRDPIFFSAAGSTVSQGTLTLNANGTWTYTPAAGFTGSTAFQFKVNDNYGGESPVRTLVITVSTNLADSDLDGIADGYEHHQWGSLAAADGAGDADLDGQSNYFEFLAGTDPQDGNESLATAPSVAGAGTANGTVKLRLNHVRPGVKYHLETSADLDAWTRLGTFTFSIAGSAEIEDPAPAVGVPRFYRMSLEATSAVILP